MIEHRCGQRISVDLPVQLSFPGGLCTSGTALNLGYEGMYIKPSNEVRRTGCLEVQITDPKVAEKDILVIPAIVVHRANGGLGLMFRVIDESVQSALKDLLIHASASKAKIT